MREFEAVRRRVAELPAQIVGPDGVVRLPTSRNTEEVRGREITGGVIALVTGRYWARPSHCPAARETEQEAEET